MFIKILVINGLIISAILGVVYFGQQKNSREFAGNFYKKATESNKYVKSADNWLNDTFYKKAQEEVEKRQEIASQSINETVEDAKKGILDSLWQATVGNLSRGIGGLQEKAGGAVSGGKDAVLEKISDSFCSAPE